MRPASVFFLSRGQSAWLGSFGNVSRLVEVISALGIGSGRITSKSEVMQTAEAAFARMPLGRDSLKLLRWPPPLRPKRAAYGVAGPRSESGQ